MKTRIAVVCVVVASALTLAGCGTVDNICLENEQTGQVPMHIYGGVEADIRFLAEDPPGPRAAKPAVDPFKVVYLAADLPLSFVADTVTLPITVPMTYVDRLSHRSNPYPNAPTQPAGGAGPPSPPPQDQNMDDSGKPAAPPGFSPVKP
jgi:uncharacterized protein YceK